MPLYVKRQGGGGGSSGGIWITDISPSGGGNIVVNKDPSVSGEETSVSSIQTDASSLLVSVTWDRGARFETVATVNGLTVNTTTATPSTNNTFRGTVIVPVSSSIVASVGAASHTVPVSLEDPAVITNFVIVNQLDGIDFYPNDQTEVKAGDTIYVSFDSDVPLKTITFQLSGASGSTTISIGHSNLNFTSIPVTVGSTTTVAALKAAVMKTQTKGAAWSGNVTTSNTINCNNLKPTVVIGPITYPVSQGALKDSQTATVPMSNSNFDSILYSTPLSQITIPNVTVDAASKTVTRIGGDYNDSSTNYSVTALRDANASSTTASTVVLIANVGAVISVSEPTPMRSGGNDGTSIQNHTVTITSDQRMNVAPILVSPVGTLGGFTYSSTAKTFTATLTISDTDTKGSYTWSGLNFPNLTGYITVVLTGSTALSVGGFVSRVISLPAFQSTVTVNTGTLNLSNVTVNWSFDGDLVRSFVDTTPIVGQFFVSTSGNTTVIHLLDLSKTNASSQASTLTIEETV